MKFILLSILFIFFSIIIYSQDNYEIQVYGSETMDKGYTMVELHSNFTFDGTKTINKGVATTNHIQHETIEITHGFNDWFEVGLYFFNAIGDKDRSGYVGSHIRPRVRMPEKFHLPVGLSLSAEVGYQKPKYSEDDWTLELRPIIDKKLNKLYLCFNPVFDKSLHGATVEEGFSFSPNIKVGYDITHRFTPGIEYYGSLGSVKAFSSFQEQQQNLFFTLDADLHPNLEFNFGYGIGFINATDNEIIKCILGWKFNNKKKQTP